MAGFEPTSVELHQTFEGRILTELQRRGHFKDCPISIEKNWVLVVPTEPEDTGSNPDITKDLFALHRHQAFLSYFSLPLLLLIRYYTDPPFLFFLPL